MRRGFLIQNWQYDNIASVCETPNKQSVKSLKSNLPQSSRVILTVFNLFTIKITISLWSWYLRQKKGRVDFSRLGFARSSVRLVIVKANSVCDYLSYNRIHIFGNHYSKPVAINFHTIVIPRRYNSCTQMKQKNKTGWELEMSQQGQLPEPQQVQENDPSILKVWHTHFTPFILWYFVWHSNI